MNGYQKDRLLNAVVEMMLGPTYSACECLDEFVRCVLTQRMNRIVPRMWTDSAARGRMLLKERMVESRGQGDSRSKIKQELTLERQAFDAMKIHRIR